MTLRAFRAAGPFVALFWAASCAVVGFDLEGYGPAGVGGGGGQGGSSSTRTNSASGSGGSLLTGGGSGGNLCNAGLTCFEPVAGWNGPFAYYQGPPGITCSKPYAKAGPTGGTTPADKPLGCSACSCGIEPCGDMILSWFGDANCKNSLSATAGPTSTDACTVLTAPLAVGSADASLVLADGSSCTPSGGQETSHPAPGFSDESLLCATSEMGDACGSNGTCVHDTSTPFNAGVCIATTGKVACPNTTPYKNRSVFSTAYVDGRECEACACGPSNKECLVEVKAFSDGACMTKAFALPNDGACHPVTAAMGVDSYAFDTTSPCEPTGGQASGHVVDFAEVTVCCAE